MLLLIYWLFWTIWVRRCKHIRSFLFPPQILPLPPPPLVSKIVWPWDLFPTCLFKTQVTSPKMVGEMLSQNELSCMHLFGPALWSCLCKPRFAYAEKREVIYTLWLRSRSSCMSIVLQERTGSPSKVSQAHLKCGTSRGTQQREGVRWKDGPKPFPLKMSF